ncbi:MAG: sulfatase-like hydrolase/transferase, partial [Pirellulaceae bacterium]
MTGLALQPGTLRTSVNGQTTSITFPVAVLKQTYPPANSVTISYHTFDMATDTHDLWILALNITFHRSVSYFSGCLLVAVILLVPATHLHAAERPDIILLMGDDHGWDETGYNGHPFLKTPVLDEMAASGLRFDRFYSAHPSCSPTRGSIITGRHPNRYGTFTPNCSIRPEEISIAHIMSKAGYACAHFGKWHLGPVKKDSPTNPGAMGFDEWLSHDNFFELNPVLSKNGAKPTQIQ